MSRRALVLFNLGGPDRLASVRPFLFNLFSDPAIINTPFPVRWFLAQLISRRRAPVAREIYQQLGGASPLLSGTQAQAEAINRELGNGWRVFVAMRYWHPFSEETGKDVKEYDPDKIVLLPLYPQYSVTTTASSLSEWQRVAAVVGLTKPTSIIGCYPTATGFIGAHAGLLREALASRELGGKPLRVLFSAHGLPKKVIRSGDPYQWQVEQTARAVIREVATESIDWRVCYQSRVGPLEWIGPSTDSEIVKAGREGKSVIVVPIAFVSEHSETLVELDIEYRRLAKTAGVPFYHRVPALGVTPEFIRDLAKMALASAAGGSHSCVENRRCPTKWSRCCGVLDEAEVKRMT